MRALRKLFLGPDVPDADRILFRLASGAGTVGFHVVTWNGRRLEITNSVFWKFAFVRKAGDVAGLARSKADALELVRQIVENCLQATGTAELEPYLVELAWRAVPDGSGR